MRNLLKPRTMIPKNYQSEAETAKEDIDRAYTLESTSPCCFDWAFLSEVG